MKSTPFILFLLFISCAQDRPTEVKQTWIELKIEEIEKLPQEEQPIQIIQWDFENKKVYMFDYGKYCCDWSYPIYDSNGSVICELGGLDGNTKCNGMEFSDYAKNETIIWKRKE